LSGERLALWNKLREEHLEKVWPLYEDLRDQRLVYRAMVGSSAIRADEIWKVVVDMRGARDQLRGLQKAYAGRLAKNGFDDVAFEPAYGVTGPCLDQRDYDDRYDRSYEPGYANDATNDGSACRHRGFRNPRRHWPNRHWRGSLELRPSSVIPKRKCPVFVHSENVQSNQWSHGGKG
jgi:hypothetical protein